MYLQGPNLYFPLGRAWWQPWGNSHWIHLRSCWLEVSTNVVGQLRLNNEQ